MGKMRNKIAGDFGIKGKSFEKKLGNPVFIHILRTVNDNILYYEFTKQYIGNHTQESEDSV